MSAFVDLFGDSLASADGLVKTVDALAGKVVGIYFSAHWCPPCRQFTPMLAEWYTKDLSAKGLEVVFVSSDKDQDAFDNYFGEQPWKALPFDERAKKDDLSKRFKVQGIPTFIILDADGQVINKDGRSAVSGDPTGQDFPWKPPTFAEALGESFVGQDGEKLGKSAVEGKVLGIYFSAHWCPPCKMFTPKLAQWYKTVKPNLPEFEIVFVSSDRDQGAFDEYFAEMPWIALPWADRKAKDKLSELFEVEGIPSFVIVDKDGSTINSSGRGIPAMDPEGTEFPWHPPAVKDLAQDTDALNSSTCLIALMEGADAASVDAVREAMKPLAEEYIAKAKPSDPEFCFYVGGSSATGIAARIRSMCKCLAPVVKHEHPLTPKDGGGGGWGCDGCMEGGEGQRHRCVDCDFDFCDKCNAAAKDPSEVTLPVTILLLDLPDDGGYYLGDGVEPTTAGFRDYLAKYTSKSLERKQA